LSKRYFMIAATLAATAATPAFATAAPTAAPSASAKPAPAAQQPLSRVQVAKNIDAQFKAIDTNGDGVLSSAELAAAEAKGLQNRAAAARAQMETRFTQLDTNHDGQLSKAEFMAAAPQPPTTAPDVSAAFANLDTNRDGKVTLADFSSQAGARFDKLDTKHAGVLNVPVPAGSPAKTITRADFVKQAANEFAAIDVAHKGFITNADLAAAVLKSRQQRVAQLRSNLDAEFTKLNTSHSGQLSKAEFMAAAPQAPTTPPDPAKVIAQLDANKDGKVSLDEYRSPILAQFDKIDTNRDGTISAAESAARAKPAKATKKR
jgi:Ca2+-binding EF-hand superfamily protein